MQEKNNSESTTTIIQLKRLATHFLSFQGIQDYNVIVVVSQLHKMTKIAGHWCSACSAQS